MSWHKQRDLRELNWLRFQGEVFRMISHHIPLDTGTYREWRR